MSVGTRPPVRFRGRPDLVGFKYSMTPPSWDVQLEGQLERYYRSKRADHGQAPAQKMPKLVGLEAQPSTDEPIHIDDDEAPTAASAEP
jgi:hypothetical protein